MAPLTFLQAHNYTALPPSDEQSNDKHIEQSTDSTVPSRLHSRVQAIIILLLAFLAGAFLSPILQNLIATIKTPHGANKLQALLSFPFETRTFVPNENFTSPPTASAQTNDVWMQLLGPSRGFIALDRPKETYGLRPGRALVGDDSSQVYGVSMFHQLHCLIMIRDLYYTALHPLTAPSAHNHSHTTSNDSDAEAAFAIEHTDHCFDYLQQSIRCAGLMQIEVPHGSRNNIFDGYGTEHTCASWTSIVEFMDRYQVGGGNGR